MGILPHTDSFSKFAVPQVSKRRTESFPNDLSANAAGVLFVFSFAGNSRSTSITFISSCSNTDKRPSETSQTSCFPLFTLTSIVGEPVTPTSDTSLFMSVKMGLDML